MSKNKKDKSFKRHIILYSIILAIGMCLALYYVYDSLRLYELGDIDNFMQTVFDTIVDDNNNNKLDKYVNDNIAGNKYEKNTSLLDGLKAIIENDKLSYKRSSKEDEYILLADNNEIGKVLLNKQKNMKRLGLLSFPVWKIDKISLDNNDGLYTFDFYITESQELYINDIKVYEEDLVDSTCVDGFVQLDNISNVPLVKKYNIGNFTIKPDVKVVEGDNEIPVTFLNNAYYSNGYEEIENLDDAINRIGSNVNILEFAENWSLYLTNDLTGSYHGFNIIENYIIAGTDFYNQAFSWGKGVDITFTSIHSFENPRFTNERVENFIFYNDFSFSVEVYLEKNMIVGREKKQDILHERIFYIKDNDTYKVVSMQNVKEE